MTPKSFTVRVQLPHHLRSLAGVDGEVEVDVRPSRAGSGGDLEETEDGGAADEHRPTVADLLDSLEVRFPALEGTIRDHDRGARRAYLRFFTCGEDVSHEGEGYPLPRTVVEGREVFRVVGAISGG